MSSTRGGDPVGGRRHDVPEASSGPPPDGGPAHAEPPVDPDVDLHVRADRVETRPRQWDLLLAIAIGGVLGSEARFGVGVALPHPAGAMPWATLLVNVSGCALIGVLMVAITELITPHRLIRPLLGVGVLGGYTTFSAYSIEVQQMLAAGRPGLALTYLAVTPLAALAAVWIGASLTRLLARLARDRGQDGAP